MHRGELSNKVLLLCFGVRVPFLFPFLFFFPPPKGLLYGGLLQTGLLTLGQLGQEEEE